METRASDRKRYYPLQIELIVAFFRKLRYNFHDLDFCNFFGQPDSEEAHSRPDLISREDDMHWKNRWMSFLVKVWGAKRTLFQGKHFLVVSTTGLGDTLWATPALRALKKRYPTAKISVLTGKLGKEVLKGHPAIDAFYLVGSSLFSFLKHVRALRRAGIDTAFIFHASQRCALPLCCIAGIGRIVGSEGLNKGLDSMLTDVVDKRVEHEIERRLRQVEVVGAAQDEGRLELFGMQKERRPEGVVIGLHPGAKNRFKQYPAEFFVQVGKQLVREFGCHIVVTGGRGEEELVASIVEKIEGACALEQGLSVTALAGRIAAFDLFITNDTGPMHVAFAVGTPTVALFGPTDPRLCGPYRANKVRVLATHKTCAPCLQKKCRAPFCLRQIGTDAVINAAREMISTL